MINVQILSILVWNTSHCWRKTDKSTVYKAVYDCMYDMCIAMSVSVLWLPQCLCNTAKRGIRTCQDIQSYTMNATPSAPCHHLPSHARPQPYRVIIRKSNLKDPGARATAKSIAEQAAAHYESELVWRCGNAARLDFEIRYVYPLFICILFWT
jgi:hypothetical protein